MCKRQSFIVFEGSSVEGGKLEVVLSLFYLFFFFSLSHTRQCARCCWWVPTAFWGGQWPRRCVPTSSSSRASSAAPLRSLRAAASLSPTSATSPPYSTSSPADPFKCKHTKHTTNKQTNNKTTTQQQPHTYTFFFFFLLSFASVVFLAGVTANRDIVASPGVALEVQVCGVANVLRAVASHGPSVSLFVFASTGKVYGTYEKANQKKRLLNFIT